MHAMMCTVTVNESIDVHHGDVLVTSRVKVKIAPSRRSVHHVLRIHAWRHNYCCGSARMLSAGAAGTQVSKQWLLGAYR